jgi:hypothetical protein
MQYEALHLASLVCVFLASALPTAYAQQPLPDAPVPVQQQITAHRSVVINTRPYQRPTHMEQFRDYVQDSYGLPAVANTTVRALFAEGTDKPKGWGQDWPGFGQRFGSAAAVTAINGNVRYGMETVFREDMRYIPCHGCTKKKKVENALLAEITARHDDNGHRFFYADADDL